MAELFVARGAVISPCGQYRYRLSRVWDDNKPSLPFVMLNPSTADAYTDDPTIRRCIAFSKREGCGGIEVANLFAFRATLPEILWRQTDPPGPDNEQHLHDVGETAAAYGVPIVCAWGSYGTRSYRSTQIMREAGAVLMCLGKTKSGQPRHPLYVKGDQPLESFHG